MKESQFQADIKREIKTRLPGAIVVKSDPSSLQGIPDLLIFYFEKWAALECKCNMLAHKQPNQEHWISQMDAYSFASFISPETMDAVLDQLEDFMKDRGYERVPWLQK